MTLTIEPDPALEQAAQIEQILRLYNTHHVGPSDGKPLTITLRDDQGNITGGLCGRTGWDWLYVGILAVAEHLRGHDWGTKILAAAEAEAQQRGCHSAHLDTFDFQALPFYQKQGYIIFGTLNDFRGHQRYFLAKKLSTGPSAPASV